MADAEGPDGSVSSVQDDENSSYPTPLPEESAVPNGSTEQQRTLGGFVVEEDEDDEDEDEEEYTPMLSIPPEDKVDAEEDLRHVDGGSADDQRLETVSTSNDKPTPDPLSSNLAQEQEESGRASSERAESVSHVAPVPSTNHAPADAPDVAEPSHLIPLVHTNAASTADASASSVTKARLPHDHVGLLEDRIKEDPRGDLDAWLSLIAEHQRRNKLDEARAVYERFFKVFPSAVSSYAALRLARSKLTFLTRRINGSHGPKWSLKTMISIVLSRSSTNPS